MPFLERTRINATDSSEVTEAFHYLRILLAPERSLATSAPSTRSTRSSLKLPARHSAIYLFTTLTNLQRPLQEKALSDGLDLPLDLAIAFRKIGGRGQP